MSEIEELLFDDKREEVKTVPAPALAHVLDLEVSEKTREIFISDEIDDDFAGWFTKVMRRLEAISNEPITIWLNTIGGDMESMFVYYDLVTQSPCPITVIGIGTVCSAGCLMLTCGGTNGGKRLVTESCTFMWHESRGGEGGGLSESEEKARREWKDWTGEYWRVLMGRHVKGKTSKFWWNITNKAREHWLLGGEAIIEAGIADALYQHSLLPYPAKQTQSEVAAIQAKIKKSVEG